MAEMNNSTRRNLVISLCGTSILTNRSNVETRELISRHANQTDGGAIPETDRKTLEQRILAAMDSLSSVKVEEAAKVSAELNAITSFYGKQLAAGRGDHHLLMCSDTWLGEQAAELVRNWLTEHGLTVELHKQSDLQTGDMTAFQLALSDMVKVLSDMSDKYRDSGYHVVFNLTGGFKSVQGFMQTLAMIYADESVYIFESGGELLRIPRLPLKLSAQNELRKHLPVFRRLQMNLSLMHGELTDVSNIFYLNLGQEYAFSAWGEIIWRQHKREIYGEKVWPSFSNKVEFGTRFLKSVQLLPEHRMYEINKKIDDLTRVLEKGESYNVKSLDFKPLSGNPVPGSTHELDAWHDQDAKRLYGHFEGEMFVLDKLGKALH